MKNIELLLKKAKYSRRYEGYKELSYCLELILEDENRLCSMMKLYEEIGRKYGVSWNSVEKNIRTVNENAWSRGGKEFINEISRESYSVTPQTGELLEIFLDYLRKNET